MLRSVVQDVGEDFNGCWVLSLPKAKCDIVAEQSRLVLQSSNQSTMGICASAVTQRVQNTILGRQRDVFAKQLVPESSDDLLVYLP